MTSTATAPRLLNRRNALRFAFAAVPAAAGVAFVNSAASAAPAAATNVSTRNGVTIEIIDAVSNAVTTKSNRSALVPGTYRPGPDTTGPVAGTSLKRVDGNFNATADNQVIEKLDVYGTIDIKGFRNVVIRNCIIRGTLATGVDTAFIIFKGDDGRGLLIEDCQLIGRGNAWVSGVRGGNYTIRRTEITNAPDGLCLTSAIGNVTAEGCWIHNGAYMEWTKAKGAKSQGGDNTYPYAGGFYTHVDGVQFHRGRNYTFRGNVIGGARDPKAGPHHRDAATTAANANGDDMYNSAFMIKQEVDNSHANKIENVLIENNWLGGGQATVNLTSGRDNNFSSTIIRNNRFLRGNAGQMYILSGPGLGKLSNNVFDDNGAPVPVSKGY